MSDNLVEYFFVKAKEGIFKRELIPVDELRKELSQEVFESYPGIMMDIRGFISHGSVEGPIECGWQKLEKKYENWAQFGPDCKDFLLIRREMHAFGSFRYELVDIYQERPSGA